METVGVRVLKAQLSQYVRRVRAGARVTVTDRGRAVAVLTPVVDAPVAVWADRLVGEGRATWAGGKPAGLSRRLPMRGKAASAMVIEDRR